MAKVKGGQVTLRGRFRPGTPVRLVRVAGEHVLRAEGGKQVEAREVDEDGVVHFESGVEVGGRYLVCGLIDGHPVEVRARGNEPGVENDSVLSQPPIQSDRVRLGDGSWADEAPEREDAPFAGVAPGPGQHQVPEGTVQRSDTARGSAHPVDAEEPVPYPRQEDVPKGTVQMSDTATGQATPVVDGPLRQDQVPDGVMQRSDTPEGVATVIPAGDAIDAVQERESSAAKASRGEPGKAAAEPLEAPEPADDGDDDAAGKLTGDALHERARELDIEGRSDMSADELRATIARREKAEG